MLPTPVSFQRQKSLIFNQRPRSFAKYLRGPARLTNLSALVLLTLLVISLFLNFRHHYSPIRNVALRSIIETLPSRPSASALDHLVIVPGHAIWIGARVEDTEDEDSWLLAPYQRGRGRPSIFRAHISLG
jgi:hypothetical protein